MAWTVNSAAMATNKDGAHPSSVVGFVAGIASGITKLVVGHPWDTLKVRLQTDTAGQRRFKGPIDALSQTVRKEGFRALYKGATPPLFGWALMDSVMLGSRNLFKLQLQSGNPKVPLSIGQHALAGLGAGITVSLVAMPIEVVKARLQVQYADKATKIYSGPINCVRTMGLWKGYGVSLRSTMLFRSLFGVLWGSYEWYSQILRRFPLSDYLVNFLAGGFSATTFWILTFPNDVVKNRIMTQPDTTVLKFPTVRSCFRYVYQTEGWRGFYRGFTPCVLRSFPTNAAALMVYEACLRFEKPSRVSIENDGI